MAVSKNLVSKNLVLNQTAGLDANGGYKIKAFNFSGVNEYAEDEDIFATGEALSGLMTGTPDSMYVVEKSELLRD